MWYIIQKRWSNEDIRYFNTEKGMFFYEFDKATPFPSISRAIEVVLDFNLKVEYFGEIGVLSIPEGSPAILNEYHFLQKYMSDKAPFAKLGAFYDQRNNEFCVTLYQTSNVKNTRLTITEARGPSLLVCFVKVDTFVRTMQSNTAP